MYYFIVYIIAQLCNVGFSHNTQVTTNPTYNLLGFSRLHLERTVSTKPNSSTNEYCARMGNDYKCTSRTFRSDAEFARRIKNDKKWDLVFDNTTRGYDIEVNFHRVSMLHKE